MTFKTIIFALALAVGSVPAANATTFTFGGSNANFELYSDVVDGITLEATGGLYDGVANPNTIISTDWDGGGFFEPRDRFITRRGDGIGVNGALDSTETDGRLGDDLLTFTFSEVVRFVSVTFTRIEADDSFDMFIDGALALSEFTIASENPFASFGGATGTSLSFGADALDDDFRISSLTVAPVPLPAGAALLLTALAGLGFARRRGS